MAALAVFDLDNTLIDRDGAFRTWATEFLGKRGLDPEQLAWLVLIDQDGKSSRETFFDAVRRRFSLAESLDDLTATYRQEVPRLYAPESSVLSALGVLREAGWHTAVVTNGPKAQEDKIRSAGLHNVLDGWCISEVEGVAKPDRQIFEAAARRCGSSLSGWMVGDTPEIDILGGIKAGLRTIWMARGREWGTTGYGPDIIVNDVAEAVDHILTA